MTNIRICFTFLKIFIFSRVSQFFGNFYLPEMIPDLTAAHIFVRHISSSIPRK